MLINSEYRPPAVKTATKKEITIDKLFFKKVSAIGQR